MSRVWVRIIKVAQFSLYSPNVVVPAITSALNGDERGLARLAALLLAARHATDWRLPEDLVTRVADTLKTTPDEL